MPVSETSQIESFFSDIVKILMEFNAQMFSDSCIYADGKSSVVIICATVNVNPKLHINLG